MVFRERFAPFDIKVGELSRFTPSADARNVKKALADGSLSVVVGTHAVSSKAVRFADLGLMVIDEERHFGRAQKEKLARMARGIHLLTMSATPIPGTLSEARLGLRSLSLIAKPPVQRSPVKTTVEPFHDAAVSVALRREQRRRGQSFVACPRIEDIEPMTDRLREIVPELKITAIHGKMPASDIDRAMMAFAASAADVLLATNIIESGWTSRAQTRSWYGALRNSVSGNYISCVVVSGGAAPALSPYSLATLTAR
jgi:transcription-repair coupling factor (superfamily II helicase)